MIRVVHPASWILMLTFSHPGSRGQKGTQSRIPDPDPQHCYKLFFAPSKLLTSSENLYELSGSKWPLQYL